MTRSPFVESALRLAWQQWTALGVAGTESSPDHAIDLEALICFTPLLGSEDPRLHEEALDWCIFHSRRLISITRLRHLRHSLPKPAREASDGFAASVNASANMKTDWPTDRKGTKATTRGKSHSPDIDHPSLIQLRLRALFGVSARAEVLLQLLRPGMTQELLSNVSLSMSALSDIGYSKPALTDVLADLTTAGLVERWRRGNRDYYSLSRRESLLGLLGGVLPATAPNWTLRFRITAALLTLESETVAKKDAVRAVALDRELERLHDELERATIKPPAARQWSQVGPWAAETLLDQSPPAGARRFRPAQKSHH
jgi:hypothetical protein